MVYCDEVTPTPDNFARKALFKPNQVPLSKTGMRSNLMIIAKN
jgi:hypothetical protein